MSPGFIHRRLNPEGRGWIDQGQRGAVQPDSLGGRGAIRKDARPRLAGHHEQNRPGAEDQFGAGVVFIACGAWYSIHCPSRRPRHPEGGPLSIFPGGAPHPAAVIELDAHSEVGREHRPSVPGNRFGKLGEPLAIARPTKLFAPLSKQDQLGLRCCSRSLRISTTPLKQDAPLSFHGPHVQ